MKSFCSDRSFILKVLPHPKRIVKRRVVSFIRPCDHLGSAGLVMTLKVGGSWLLVRIVVVCNEGSSMGFSMLGE